VIPLRPGRLNLYNGAAHPEPVTPCAWSPPLLDRLRRLRPWRAPIALAAASALVLSVSPRSLQWLEINALGLAKDIGCGWARIVARREGVVVFAQGDLNERTVALTFDDGPHPNTCSEILNVLRREKVRATFFPVGYRLQQYPHLLDRMVAEGHEVGNHTWTHRRLTTLKPDEVRREVRQVRDLVYRRTGEVPVLIRPPGGTYDTRVLEICSEEGFGVCLWSDNAGDWKRMPVAEVSEKVLRYIHPGAIVLMHDEFMQTPRALERIIPELRARGYRFVTASEMRGLPPPPSALPVLHRRWNVASR
jgi:peptidoglycan-N-acetylglucosamine deacetylase